MATVTRSRPRTRHLEPSRTGQATWAFLACVIGAASIAGFLIASGGLLSGIAIAIGVLTLAVSLVWAIFHTRIRPGFIAIELPVLLLLLSTLTLRQRDVDALATNPLDPAGFFRVVCVGLASVLGVLALTSGLKARDIGRVTTRPFRLYCWYGAVVFLGVLTSVNPKLTAFHGVDLLAGILCVAGAYFVAGLESTKRLLSLIYWWLVAGLACVWLGALLNPGLALKHIDSPLPWQLQGVFPVNGSNGVGSLGEIVAIWSLAILLSPNEPPGKKRIVTGTIVVLGSITLLFAQYRTGYAGAILAVLVLLALRKRMMIAGLLATVVAVAWMWGEAIIQHAQPLILRGQSVQQASDLSGRIGFWSAAIPVWKESPLIGSGLLTATRFEVLNNLGHGGISTIHNTWIEALVGTGVIGLAFLLASFLVLFARAAKEAMLNDGRIVPLLLLTMIAVRSFTDSSIEQMEGGILFMILALSFRDHAVSPALAYRPSTVTRQLS